MPASACEDDCAVLLDLGLRPCGDGTAEAAEAVARPGGVAIALGVPRGVEAEVAVLLVRVGAGRGLVPGARPARGMGRTAALCARDDDAGEALGLRVPPLERDPGVAESVAQRGLGDHA